MFGHNVGVGLQREENKPGGPVLMSPDGLKYHGRENLYRILV